MKRVLVITYYWPPSGGSGVQRWLKFVKYFPEFGYEPYVLTVKPEKASYPVLDPSLADEIPAGLKVFKTNTFELFNIYRKLIGKGNYPHSSFDNERKPSLMQKTSRFIRGNLFLPDSRIGWKRYAVDEGIRIISEYKINTIITTGPPHSVHLAGLELKNLTGVNWIADFRDPWTDIFYYDAFYHTRLAKRIDANLERKVVEGCHRLTIVSQALKDLIRKKSDKICPGKIVVLPNGFDEDDFKTPGEPPQNEFVITYTGSLTNDTGKMNVFVESLRNIKNEFPDIPVFCHFIGNINPSVYEIFARFGIADCVRTTPYVPHNESVSYLKKSTALILFLRRADYNKGILSGKIFDYLGAQKPIICIGPEDGNASQILQECQAGRAIDYENKEGIMSYLRDLFLKWKINRNLDLQGQEYKNYSRRNLTEKLVTVIEKIS
ncbi:MAG: glycosyltransferase family 4 protein [Bacteroidetes bacterium]|nr:glycosyltransferase family 4 protein [Bacteroidota bacterium]